MEYFIPIIFVLKEGSVTTPVRQLSITCKRRKLTSLILRGTGVWRQWQWLDEFYNMKITKFLYIYQFKKFSEEWESCCKYGNATNALHLCNGLAQLLKITNTKKQTPYLDHTSVLLTAHTKCIQPSFYKY